MKPIQSMQNPMIKYYQKLKKRKFRESEKKFLVEGVRFVEEALRTQGLIDSLIYSLELIDSERGQRLLSWAGEQGARMISVEKSIINYLASTEAPQGVMAVCEMKEWTIEEVFHVNDREMIKSPIIVLVDGVADPGNLGTIIRSAHAFGAKGVILMSGTVDIYNDKALRATMGSIFHLPVINNILIKDLPIRLFDDEWQLLMGVPRGGSLLNSVDLKSPSVLLVGSEAEGASTDFYMLPHKKVTVPMAGNVESLNVAVAASIMLFQISLGNKN